MKNLIFLFIIASLYSCSTTKNYHVSNESKNSKESLNAPYVLLISLDGYRWDYTDKYKPKFLSNFKKSGASVKSLRPSFPTKTFPNHLSLATGMYPMNHGIVGNSFYAPTMRESYSLRNREAVTDPRFYLSKPIWVLAEEQSLKSATYFWPGSEAKIDGKFPSYYLTYNHSAPHADRIKTIIEWFKLPESIRPHLVTLYFSDVDSAGHKFGPNSPEVKSAIEKVDHSLNTLNQELKRLKLPINIIIVSDHGMDDVSEEKVELIASGELREDIELSFKIVGSGPLIHFYSNDNPLISSEATLERINKNAKNFKCYDKDSTPRKLNFRENDRIGDIVCIAKEGWSIGIKEGKLPKGNHGWSQFEGMNMHSILYADGPDFKKNTEIGTVNNIDLYPLIAKILNLKIEHKIDGSIDKIKELLK
ncbi:putative phosphodiesterase-nucleotide pyrophosphatase [Halobacteriovorax marinus SJ]|uniref:Phosphodiesterase-nucleotide pyrophosphatase n=1 Tax=Halobacteriovorax marinus (strain ATCC BAA-682 / DSM 15412 / SJ) TaxID=862908 RepID=E1WYP9_HALMS|nr:ectonucleotide pyrophosphatase/phosphodiesterase [Halobacteriovorax marinus]CBW27689.1 putative phosphodiesterase-nucleotide pyrophosphatase [Halobacteriovorax marinus SJ]